MAYETFPHDPRPDARTPIPARQLGWDDDRAAECAAHPASACGAVPGRVTRVERGRVRIMTERGTVTVQATDLAVGDWVLTDGETWATALTRRSELRRKEAGPTSGEQVLAANVDVVVAIEPMDPPPSPHRVERMVTLAWGSGATPLVVLTKADLGTGEDIGVVQSVVHGVDVLAVSAVAGTGLDELRQRLLPGQTFVLLGPSGAGKSTLVNALADHEILATGAVRGDGRGKHTTTHRELVVVPGLASLIDTPGIREVGLTADADGLDQTFEDIVDLAEQCRFADCAHETEPGCALTRAIADGVLDEARLASYRRLLKEIAHQSARKTAAGRAAARARARQFGRAAREVMALKGR
jgi:ribosome biogenesis GTPase / thiamine phosphate phosphatase